MKRTFLPWALFLTLSTTPASLCQSGPEANLPDAPAHVAQPTGARGSDIPAPVSRTPEDRYTSDPTLRNVPSSYRPDSAMRQSLVFEKFGYYADSTVSVRNLMEALLVTGVPEIPSIPKQPADFTSTDMRSLTAYRIAMDNYNQAIVKWPQKTETEARYVGRRFAVGLTTSETRMLLSNFVLPVALHQNPRYIPASIEDESFGQRIGHALTSVVIGTTDTGRSIPNYAELGGTVGAAFLGAKVYAPHMDAPELNSGRFVGKYVLFSLAGDAATNVTRELLRSWRRPDVEFYDERGRLTEDNYYPLSFAGKVNYWGRSAAAPRNFVQAILLAGYPSGLHRPELPYFDTASTPDQLLVYDQKLERWAQHVQTWRRSTEVNLRYRRDRMIMAFGESETQQFLANFALPAALKLDPRYVPVGAGHSFSRRMVNPFAAVVFSHNDSGQHVFNLPLLGGTIGAALIANYTYYRTLHPPPEDQGRYQLTGGRIVSRTIAFNLAGDALINVCSEFFGHRKY